MASEYTLPESKLTPGAVVEQLRLHGWSLASCGATVGLCGGLAVGLLGGILTVMSWFTGSHFHGFALQRDGTVLMGLMIPFLLFGAHCLDLLEKRGANIAETIVQQTFTEWEERETDDLVGNKKGS